MQLTEGDEDLSRDSSSSFALPCKALSTLYRSVPSTDPLQVIHTKKKCFCHQLVYHRILLKITSWEPSLGQSKEKDEKCHTEKFPKFFPLTISYPSAKGHVLTSQDLQLPESIRMQRWVKVRHEEGTTCHAARWCG